MALYDEQRRVHLLDRLRDRGSKPARARERTIALKVEYSPDLKPLRLKSRIERLVTELRKDIGEGFLLGARFVIAQPVQRNLFMHT